MLCYVRRVINYYELKFCERDERTVGNLKCNMGGEILRAFGILDHDTGEGRLLTRLSLVIFSPRWSMSGVSLLEEAPITIGKGLIVLTGESSISLMEDDWLFILS